MTISITKQVRTETGHRLMDVGDHKESHLHGHSLLWELCIVSSDLPERNHCGMIADPKDVDTIIQEVIVDQFDRSFVFHEDDPLIEDRDYDEVNDLLKSTIGKKPRLLILDFNPTMENLVQWVAEQIKVDLKPKGLNLSGLTVWETEDSFASFIEPPF